MMAELYEMGQWGGDECHNLEGRMHPHPHMRSICLREHRLLEELTWTYPTRERVEATGHCTQHYPLLLSFLGFGHGMLNMVDSPGNDDDGHNPPGGIHEPKLHDLVPHGVPHVWETFLPLGHVVEVRAVQVSDGSGAKTQYCSDVLSTALVVAPKTPSPDSGHEAPADGDKQEVQTAKHTKH
jgi:hypothetical protein